MGTDDTALQGKVALVTGASRGIGLATAHALAAAGARVAMLARSAERLHEAAAGVAGNPLAVVADIQDPDAVRTAFAEVDAELGRLDILVNNAAVGRVHTIEEATDEDIAAGVGTNFTGVIYCCREAIKRMRIAEGGNIVNVSSESVTYPLPYLSLYVATKGGLESLSAALRRELAPANIRVTVVRSGAASAGFAEEWEPGKATQVLESWQRDGYLEYVGKPMEPEVIAEAIVQAASQPAGSNLDLIVVRSASAR